MLEMFNLIKEKREVPDQWNRMMIVTIFKQKGSKKMLKNYRGIFLTVIISKIFEGLIKDRIKDQLEKVNILQAGSRTKRGAADNVFLLRAVIDHRIYTKEPLYVTAYDYEQAFDSLWMEDCLLSLKELDVSKEMLQLIYSLNKNAKVVVQTPNGLTKEFTTEPIVKQGTVLGSILCSSSTGEYCGKNIGVAVGTMILASLLYVDDIIDLSNNASECLRSHENALSFSDKKKLSLSGTKCFNMVVNPDSQNEPLSMQIDNDKVVVIADSIVYLGDVFDSRGSNEGLIKDRVARGTKAMISIQSLLAEEELGRFRTSVSLLLYQSLFLSTVLFNSGTWSKLKDKEVERLTTLQLRFLKKIMRVAKSTCNAFVFLELGVLPIEHEIRKRQLMYLHRILQLDQDDPVYKMFESIKELDSCGERNWWSGVKENLMRYQIGETLDEISSISQDSFKEIVKNRVKETAFSELTEELKSKKKTQNLRYEEFALQTYLLDYYPCQARTIFKCRSQTLDLKTNLTYKYKDTTCRLCGVAEETINHATNCGNEDTFEWNCQDLATLSSTNSKLCVKRLETFLENVADM